MTKDFVAPLNALEAALNAPKPTKAQQQAIKEATVLEYRCYSGCKLAGILKATSSFGDRYFWHGRTTGYIENEHQSQDKPLGLIRQYVFHEVEEAYPIGYDYPVLDGIDPSQYKLVQKGKTTDILITETTNPYNIDFYEDEISDYYPLNESTPMTVWCQHMIVRFCSPDMTDNLTSTPCVRHCIIPVFDTGGDYGHFKR